MRIFVAGATGAVGRRLFPRLIENGHNVVGLTRTSAKTGLLRQLGAEPVVTDALDEKAIHAAVVAARPDVIVHQLTDLKGAFGPAPLRSGLREQQPAAHRGDRPPACSRARLWCEADCRAKLLRLALCAGWRLREDRG